MSQFLQDLRYAMRMLKGKPGFTIVAVLTLGLGIGANTAVFSAVYGILFRPLPYREADRLVAVWTRVLDQPGSRFPASLPDIRDWQAESQSFEGLAAYAYNRYKVAGLEGDDLVRAAIVTPEFFSVLGVRAAAGRLLRPEDEQIPVTVLSHALARRLFNDANPIGQALRLNEGEYTIVGVMPAEFRFPTPDVDLWVSMSQIYAISGNPSVGNWLTNRSLRGYRPFARLKKGITLEQAHAEMDAIQARLGEQYPDDSGLGVALMPLREQMVGRVERPLMVLLAGVGFVLLIACANVANLMLARATSREREMAIRRALGAGGRRIAGQLLTESVLLSFIGGALGVFLAVWGVEFFVRMSPADIPRLESVGVDITVLLYAASMTFATGILFGLAPALRTRRLDLFGSLREGSREAGGSVRTRAARQMLVVGEVALAVVVVVGAGLLINSFLRLMRVDVGFSPDRLLTVGVGISLNRYPNPDDQVRYLNRVLERVRSTPRVETAGACTSLPPNITQQAGAFSIDDEPVSTTSPRAWYLPATPGFTEALGLPLVRGRTFADLDDASGQPVAIINRALSERYFADRDPIGRRVNVAGAARTIVGVIGDTRYDGLAMPAGFQIYIPFAQRPFPGMYVVVRSNTDARALIDPVREAILSVDPLEEGSRFRTMTEILGNSINEPRFYTLLLGIFGLVALALAAIGTFGVISYSVAQRTREIGVRIALGAGRSSVVAMVLRESLRVIAAGVVLGVTAAFGLTRLLESLLFEVRPTDPITFASVVVLLLGVGLAAAFFPAQRAARVDPMTALRCE